MASEHGEWHPPLHLDTSAPSQWRRIVLDRALDALIGIDEAGRVMEWNRQAELTFGFSRESAMGREMAELIIPPEMRERHREGMARFRQTGFGPILNRRVEFEANNARGQRFPVELTVIPVPTGESHHAFYAFVRDISTRKAFERERLELLAREKTQRSRAEEREAQLRLLLDSVPALIAFVDSQLRFVFTSQMYGRLLGAPPTELQGMPVESLLGPEAYAIARPWLLRALDGSPGRYELKLKNAEGDPVDLEVQCVPFRSAPSAAPGAAVIGYDVTRRNQREADQRLLTELARRLSPIHDLELLAETATQMLCERLAADECWVSWFEAGRPTVLPERCVSTRTSLHPQLVALIDPQRPEPFALANGDPRVNLPAATTGALIAAPLVRNDEVVGVLCASSRQPRRWSYRECQLVKSFGDTLWSALQELLKQHRVETERQELLRTVSLERTRLIALLEQMPAGVIISDEKGALLLRNKLLDELIGGFIPAETIGEWAGYLGFRSNGTRYGPHDWPLARSLERGEVVRDEEIQYVRLDGGTTTLSISSAPVRDEAGKIIAGVVVHIDVSARKQLERGLTEAVRARDEFLSVASHELRTPVTSMKLRFDSLKAQLSAAAQPAPSLVDKALLKLVDVGERQLQRMAKLIEEMLDVSRIATNRLKLEVARVDLAALVRDTVDRFLLQANEAHAKLVFVTPRPVWIDADRSRLEQVVDNLITNALKYGQGKPVHLEVRAEDRSALLQVRDEGPGIAPEDLERIFERFERATSQNIGGLGLGLYISRSIVEAHGGHIWAESGERGGSTFTVELPLSPERQSEPNIQQRDSPIAGSGNS